MRKVLIVEDDQAMAVALRDGFSYEGYTVQVARDGATGLQLARERGHDLVILDVMLPRMSGLDVCRQLRSAGNDTPVIMLTARGQEIDKRSEEHTSELQSRGHLVFRLMLDKNKDNTYID